ncbi:unnamed protein product [Arabidopsis lyrata]|uniref:Replication protein A 70 kDa DNA-binding subunit B/D first OB fold domain-containing protein n=1 Tax=Arabidopsis lyrata subsp. lyrata TaxID=81972 RepID=D7KBL2_ARALL|nr:uncharacterized protein LOC9328875 [Arabidopsis lyrata subsp. lyrata]EFH69072.1 hypothetical protein ARALYDRAFT_334744 [Arabidopsis lyrata subsp. lyrata]CAH8252310.1 unnamed protein product [Arabidopsis lyrata]|eukprot:XP_002892813.1 uncharacterized protein LOC9328875 [Arabidopsis lyrata subsp. lyrata]
MAHLLSNAVRNSFNTKVAYTDVSSLNPFVHEWRLRVKILRKFVRCFGNHNTVDLILVDEKGQKIHAVIDGDYIDRVCRRITVGDWISLRGFKLTLALYPFRPVPHRFMLRWQDTTVMKKISPVSSNNFFSFASFDDVNSGILDPAVCVDLIGEIIKVGNPKEDGGPNNDWNEIYFQLQDKTDNILQCRLPKDYANDFFNKWRHCTDDILICIMRFAKLEVNSGSWLATSAYTCTEIMINFPCQEVTDMKHAVLTRECMQR